MSAVCNWLSIFSCMRGSPTIRKPVGLKHQVHPNRRPGTFDAVIVWKGKETKTNPGGVAYEVILKPASNDGPRPSSPPKEKSLTHDDIAKKLQEAEERRQSLEAQKLEALAKERLKAQEVLAKQAEEEQSFSRATQEKLRRSLEVNKENREAQIKALQERLRDHLLKVEETCRQNEETAKELEEKIRNKQNNYEENKKAYLQAQIDRLREHGKRIREVCKSSASVEATKEAQERYFQKLEKAARLRDETLKGIQDRCREHEKKIEEVRKNKPAGNGSNGSTPE